MKVKYSLVISALAIGVSNVAKTPKAFSPRCNMSPRVLFGGSLSIPNGIEVEVIRKITLRKSSTLEGQAQNEDNDKNYEDNNFLEKTLPSVFPHSHNGNFTRQTIDGEKINSAEIYDNNEEMPNIDHIKLRTYESDLVVVLDMDECLIHSQFLQGPGAKYAHQVQQNGSSSFIADAATTKSVDTFNVTLPDGQRVLVHERPHLHDFLREVSSKYETHIFTAAMEVYAKPVLKMLDPYGEIFSGIWYRESCQLDSSMGAYIKNLGVLFESHENDEERQQKLNRTVLVDNNPLSFLANPEHGILVSSFYDDCRDTTLPAVLDLLHELDKHEDVRPVLDAKFRLRQALGNISRGHPFSGREQQIDEQEEEEQTSIAVVT